MRVIEVPPGTHILTKTISMTDHGWEEVVRTAFGTSEEKLNGSGESLLKRLDGGSRDDDPTAFPAK